MKAVFDQIFILSDGQDITFVWAKSHFPFNIVSLSGVNAWHQWWILLPCMQIVT
jgi:hypothetical protein